MLNLVGTPHPTVTSQLSFSFQSDAKSTEGSAGVDSGAGVLPGTSGATSPVGGTSVSVRVEVVSALEPVESSPFFALLLDLVVLAFAFPSPVFARRFFVLGSALSPSPLESSHSSSPFDRFLAAALTCKWLFDSKYYSYQSESISQNA